MSAADWFGDSPCMSMWSGSELVQYLREVGEDLLADELDVPPEEVVRDEFAVRDTLPSLLSRFVRTTSICGFLPPDLGAMKPVATVDPDPELRGKRLRICLEGLHVAKYPGMGRHRLLFDFAVQLQGGKMGRVYHYASEFQARDGETVPVHGFPLFQQLPVGSDGLVLGFQTINMSSQIDETLLSFLATDDFKQGLSLASLTNPLLGQVSAMASTFAAWACQRSRNAKVQEFHQGLRLAAATLGGGLAPGYYVIAQIPIAGESEWRWEDWTVSPTSTRLVTADGRSEGLTFNHVILSVFEQ